MAKANPITLHLFSPTHTFGPRLPTRTRFPTSDRNYSERSAASTALCGEPFFFFFFFSEGERERRDRAAFVSDTDEGEGSGKNRSERTLPGQHRATEPGPRRAKLSRSSPRGGGSQWALKLRHPHFNFLGCSPAISDPPEGDGSVRHNSLPMRPRSPPSPPAAGTPPSPPAGCGHYTAAPNPPLKPHRTPPRPNHPIFLPEQRRTEDSQTSQPGARRARIRVGVRGGGPLPGAKPAAGSSGSPQRGLNFLAVPGGFLLLSLTLWVF